MSFKLGDKATEQYAKDLSKVLAELESNIYNVFGKAKTKEARFDANTILNSRGDMLQSLRDAGYSDLANKHIANYPEIVNEVRADFAKRKLPPVKFGKVSAETFKNIARADLEMFNVIGVKAMDDLRLELYRHSISSKPFSNMVAVIRAATTGIDGKGSPLKNYAYTHANTAILKFGGDVVAEAGESIGAERWEVVGVSDESTRDDCRDALADPIRTKKEWQDAGYWGGSPGGWNCRHTLYPYLGK